MTDGTIDGQQIQYTKQLEVTGIRGVADELLKVHGVAPGKESDGVTRLVMENPNGFNTIIRNNTKLGKAREIIDELQADVVAYTEHRINCRHKRNRNGMSQMFRGGETEIRRLVGHNTHENISRVQEEGSSLLLFGTVLGQYDFEHSGKDDTGLGRWVSMVFQGQNDIVTWIVCAYNPCYNTKKGSRTTYQQHRRYLSLRRRTAPVPGNAFEKT